MKKFLTFFLVFVVAGCASTPPKIYQPFTDPEYGMTKRQLLDTFGKPDAVEIYKKSDETRVEYDIYFRKFQSSQEKVPVCLLNNKVVGWGKTYYEDHVSMDDVRIK